MTIRQLSTNHKNVPLSQLSSMRALQVASDKNVKSRVVMFKTFQEIL
jgi:hypothetical protein